MTDEKAIEWTHSIESCPAPRHETHSGEVTCEEFPTVADRVDHCRQVLEACFDSEGAEPIDRVVDLLADLLQYAEAEGIDIHQALLAAEDCRQEAPPGD